MKNLKEITSSEDLDRLILKSENKPQIIFKHSTSCSISSFVKNRVFKQLEASQEDLDFYYLDLLSYRNISNMISDKFQIRHESPQLLVIADGKSVYHTSHLDISLDAIPVAMQSNKL